MAETIRKTFEFGPGTSQPRSHFRTFSVPAGSNVGVAVDGMDVDGQNGTIPVIIEVRQASAASIGSTGPDGPLIAIRSANAPSGVVAFQGQNFTSRFGCPSTWRVRVRSAIGPDVPAKVSGTIAFVFTPPGSVTLDMTGADTQHLDPHVVATRTLRSRFGSTPSAIEGTGRFRIKAKWHTDPADVLHFGTFEKLKVELLRPDGTTAASETGFSQHAPADKTPKVDFGYTVATADDVMPGDWVLRITNDSDVRVVDFDIDRGIDPNPAMPNFTSTFTARCS
jgi:hypothetical protein